MKRAWTDQGLLRTSRWLKAVLAAAAFVLTWSPASSFAGASEDVVLTFCHHRTGDRPADDCRNSTQLWIPGEYFQYEQGSRRVWPIERVDIGLIVQYPSFRPWSELPFWRRWRDARGAIRIELRGLTAQSVSDIHAGDFLGDPKPEPMPPSYGLLHYQRHTWGVNDIYVAPGKSPEIRIQCAQSTGDRQALCTAQTLTDWGLLINYRFPREYLPHWADIQARVLSLIHSFETKR